MSARSLSLAQSARSATGLRSGAVAGFAFIVLLFFSAAAVSLPEPDAAGRQVVDFYTHQRIAVTITQLLALCATPLLVLFALRLRAVDRRSGTAAFVVAMVGTLPGIAALILADVADPRHTGAAHAITAGAGLADDALFLVIAGFAATVWAARTAYRRWLRGSAVVVGLLCLTRGVLGIAHLHGTLDALGPIAFLGLVAALSVRMWLATSGPARPAARQLTAHRT